MPNSMTGYGLGVSEQNGRTVTVECRSVNHRYLDLSLRLPFALSSFEMPIRQLFKDELSRGRVDIFVTVTTDESVPRNIAVDEALALGYTEAVKRLEHIAKRETKDLVALVAAQRGALTEEELTEDQETLKSQLLEAAASAIEALKATRRAEGERLATDLRNKTTSFKKLIDDVAKRSPEVVDLYREKLLVRAEELLGESYPEWYDHQRLFAETALFADRSSIDEEVTRLRSHATALETNLSLTGPVGRKLDFLIQEINREVNTIGSKANDLDIANTVVLMKTQLEAIREQVQNLE